MRMIAVCEKFGREKQIGNVINYIEKMQSARKMKSARKIETVRIFKTARKTWTARKTSTVRKLRTAWKLHTARKLFEKNGILLKIAQKLMEMTKKWLEPERVHENREQKYSKKGKICVKIT